MLAYAMWMGRPRAGATILFGLCILAMLVLAVLASIWLIRQLRSGSSGSGNTQEFRGGPPPMPMPVPVPPSASASNPLQLLDERLARGEIDEADYQSRRALLLQNQGS